MQNKQSSKIDFTLAKNATVQFNISSSNGKVWIVQNKMLQAGKLHEQINVETLQPGLYFLKVITSEKQYNLTFIKQ